MVRLLLRKVALRLSGISGPLQGGHALAQRISHPLQSLNTPVGRPLNLREQPPNPRRHGGERRTEQLGRERGKVKVMHEASMRGREGDNTHANGAYIIGMTRFPPPPAGMFAITVLLGHTSTVAPSDVPSVFNSG